MKNSCEKGRVIKKWYTGDIECNAYSKEYECGAIYNHNCMDIVGNRDHDCFWDCSNCKRSCSEEDREAQDEEVIVSYCPSSSIDPAPKNTVIAALNSWNAKLEDIKNEIISLDVEKMSKQDILDEVVRIVNKRKLFGG